MSDSHDPILIGVDGGGTGCRAAVGTARRGILGKADGGRANVATEFDLAISNVHQTINDAGAVAGLTPDMMRDAVAHIGLAGVMTDADARRVKQAFSYGRCTVTDDRPTTVTGALDGLDGYMVAVGTGTIVAASRRDAMRFVGGWGFQVADQASGAWLGRKLLEQVLLCHDGLADHSGLTRKVLSRFSNDANQITAFSLTAKPGDYGSFAPEITAGANAGDEIAGALITEGVGYLTRALDALGFDSGDRLCLTGGLGDSYRSHLPDRYRQNCVLPAGSALQGAFALAARNLVTS